MTWTEFVFFWKVLEPFGIFWKMAGEFAFEIEFGLNLKYFLKEILDSSSKGFLSLFLKLYKKVLSIKGWGKKFNGHDIILDYEISFLTNGL